MLIFIFLIFFSSSKNTFLTEFNGVFNFSCFAFFSKIILMRFSNFLWSFFTSKKSIFNAKNEISENSESSENAENAENPHQNFDCYGVIQECALFPLDWMLVNVAGPVIFGGEGMPLCPHYMQILVICSTLFHSF